MEKKRDTFT